MRHPSLALLTPPALTGLVLILTSVPAHAWDPFGPWPARGTPPFGSTYYSPSLYGYPLDDPAPGYYGGGRYREYYSYGRPYGLANFPGPLPIPTTPFGFRRPAHLSPPHDAAEVVVDAPPFRASSPKGGVASLEVQLPAEAELWIEGRKTSKTGASREFVTPLLSPSESFVYEVRARWREGERDVEQTRQVPIRAGDRLNVRFPIAAEEGTLPAPKEISLGQKR
jgi:uncharacterized protein (TIGR03000 family)